MHRLICSINVRCRVWLKNLEVVYDVVIFSLTQRELSGSSLICVLSVKTTDKDLA